MSLPARSIKRASSWLAGALVLLACERLGDVLAQWLALPVPGAVLGMVLLLFGLMVYGSVPRGLAEVSGLLLRSLALLFLPAAVGVFFLHGFSAADWLALLAATTIGTLTSFLVTALLLRRLLGQGNAGEADD
ncbi:hypothetical protein AUP74_00787 [Microbulbifer aggregans]|uniref:Holin-like protein CidA n=1 Tax=Microbulbifer aggregans TaxID=1769779 RepID=A0A1C9W521_9GAMM|nr:CidA/LrgA family protein [Microbulbifer aggregans]AOS96254.1 hypothetical protein AUP74_00787 [Microbulbifer aggregans]